MCRVNSESELRSTADWVVKRASCATKCVWCESLLHEVLAGMRFVLSVVLVGLPNALIT